MPNQELLTWVDVETTGLNVEDDYLLEVASVVTTYRLQPVASFHAVVCWPSVSFLQSVSNNFCKKAHTASGLFEACVRSENEVDEVDEALARFLDQVGATDCVMAGNSVHFDRKWLESDLPESAQRFHYRNLDVTSVAAFFRLAKPELPLFKKSRNHRAPDDLEESLGELRYYCGVLGVTPWAD